MPHQISAGPGSGTNAVGEFANDVNIASEENELNSVYAKIIASNKVGGNWQELYVKSKALLDKTKNKLWASQSECLDYMMAADRESQKVKSYRAADASELVDCLKPTLQPALSTSTTFTKKT